MDKADIESLFNEISTDMIDEYFDHFKPISCYRGNC